MTPDPAEADRWQALYAELKQLARARLRRSAGPAVLNTTALVHESFLRLNDGGLAPAFASRGHFFAYAAKVMRSVLVDLAREQQAQRRGGGLAELSLDTAALDEAPAREPEVGAVHEALLALEQLEPRLAQVVELRYFAGLSEAEIAGLLGLTERTVRRDWVKARALLRSLLE